MKVQLKKRQSFNGNVYESLKRQTEPFYLEHPGSKKAEHLNKAIKFDLNLCLTDVWKKTAKILFDSFSMSGYKQDERFKVFEIILANLLSKKNIPIRISLNKNDWKKSKYNPIGWKIINDTLSLLVNNELLLMSKGFYNIPNKEPKQTRIEATKKLLKLFPEHNSQVISKPIELVILKGKKVVLKDNEGNRKVLKRKKIDYKESEQTSEVRKHIWKIRKTLAMVNEVNSKAEIKYKEIKLNGNLVAVFIENFRWGGRLQTSGHNHYQGLSGKETAKKANEREKITINGDSTVELDYCALHPNLLYATEGIQYEGDPYNVVDARPVLRKILKAILLRMINCKSSYHVRSSVNIFIQNQPKEYQDKVFDMNFDNDDIDSLIEKFLEVHKPIAHYLCSGKENGLKLMNKDSKIALDVINHFGKRGIPILAIHDSFRVQKQYRNELYSVMKNTYKKRTNGFEIQIKKVKHNHLN